MNSTKEITDRYYKKEEYKSLTSDQKQKLYQLRKKRKRGEYSNKLSKDKSSKAQISALKSKIKAMDSQIAAIESKQAEEVDSSEDESETETGGNRNYLALTCQKRKNS